MHSTTQPGWARLPVGVVALGLYCVVGSALVTHLVASAPAVEGTPYDARSAARATAAAPARVIVSIAIHEDDRHSSSVLCATRPDRVSSDVIEVRAEDFPDLYLNLECNLRPPNTFHD